MTQAADDVLGDRSRSGLLLVLPELAGVLDNLRSRYTLDGRFVPPHITVLHPFFSATEWSSDTGRRFSIASKVLRPITVTVTGRSKFPGGVTYLTVEPRDELRALIKHFATSFPETPPYLNRFADPEPHVTLIDDAVVPDHEAADVEAEVQRVLEAVRGMRLTTREVAVLQRLRPSPASWDVRGTFRLGA